MTNSNSPGYKIGDRIECGKSFGIIKYIGPVEGANRSGTWIGIDWDDPTRGKHNGTLDGHFYFNTRYPNSGSFVRPEKLNFGQSAVESITSRYGVGEDEFTARINQQKQLRVQQSMNAPFLEMVGFEKVFTKQSNLSNLKVVNLRDQNISFAGNAFQLADICPNIEELDISKNLLSSWTEVYDICKQLEHLRWLNVSENLMRLPDDYRNYRFPNLETLICAYMELDWSQILEIVTTFPNITEFRVPNNKITSLSPVGDVFQNLRVLDLEGNRIESWSEICKLNDAALLEQLILENIGLKMINFTDIDPVSRLKTCLFKNLKRLSLVNNLITEWQTIGELNRLEQLTQLKFLKNPILDIENRETVFQIVIARVGNLQVLNNTEIEAGERRGAEYDYIKKYGLEWLKVKGSKDERAFFILHNRYQELIEKYGEPEESELVTDKKVIKSSLIELKLIYNDRIINKNLPCTISVQKLEILVQKLFRLSNKPSLTYRSSQDSNIIIRLDDELKEIDVYSVQNGDEIIVTD